MPPPRNRSRDELAAALPAEEATRGCPLPGDLLLEIFARSDAATLIRCAASCRSIRRDILRPAFVHRVCNDGAAVPPCLLGFLRLDFDPVPMPPPSFSLAHPATPAAVSLAETRLASLAPRADRLAAGYHYRALASRDGLVLLRHLGWHVKQKKMMSSMCVYDPMTGKGTFFPGPPDAGAGQDAVGHASESYYHDKYKFVLLTAADGVGCPFLVLSADFAGISNADGSCSVIVRTFSPSSDSAGGAWSPVSYPNFWSMLCIMYQSLDQ